MKKFVSIGLLMLSLNSYGREEQGKLPVNDASYVGGHEALKAYLSSRLNFVANHIEGNGTVYLEFTVDQNGSVSRVQVLQGINQELDALALTAFQQMPSWKPAVDANGQKVASHLVLPVRFKA